MKRISIFILFFALCLSLFSFRVYSEPVWSGNISSTPSKYSSNSFSECNITWSDLETGSLIYIEQNWTTPASNLTMTNTYGGNIYNNSQILPAGTYYWKSYANNSTGWNVSDTWTFTISQADNPVHLYLNVTSSDSNRTYTYPQAINATATSASGTVYLYRNLSYIINGTSPQPELILLGNGTYNYTVNATGNQNYSDNVTGVTYYAFVNKGIPTVTLYINGSNVNSTVRSWEIINLTAISNVPLLNVSLNLNATIGYGDNFQNNATPQINLTNTTVLGIGIFNFSAQVIGEGNYSNSTLGMLYVYVTNLNFSEGSTSPSSGVNYSTNANYNFSIKVSGNISKVIFESDLNGTMLNYTGINITNWNKTVTVNNDTAGNYWINFTDLPANTYHYRWWVNDTNNISISTSQMTYVINSCPIIPAFNSDATWSTAISTSVTLTCSDSLHPVSFLITGGLCSAGTGNPANPANCTFNTPSSSGYTPYFCEVNNNTNYSTYSLSHILYYNTSELYTPISTPSGSFTVTPSSSSITIKPGENRSVTLTLKNTYSYNITSINITVSGISTSWYSLNKANISRLQLNGGTDTVLLNLTVPNDAERKSYSIIVSAAGIGSGSKLTRQVSITLTVPVEAPQNATNNTNETGALNTTGIENLTNQTNVTGLSIKLEDIKDYIVLIFASVAIILIFIFRGEFTDLIRGNKPKVHPEHKVHEEKNIEEQIHKEQKKLHRIISHIKKKISFLNEHRLVIQVKKKETKEEKKEEKT